MKTTSDKITFSLAAALSLMVVCANGYLCLVNQEHPQQYLMAIALVFIAWTCRHFFGGKTENNSVCNAARRDLTLSIVFACLLLIVGLIARSGWIGEEFRGRSVGFFTGVFVVLLANVIPKRAGSARNLAIRRAGGWALVLGGLGYTFAWLLLPLAYAGNAAIAMMMSAIAYAIGSVVWLTRKHQTKR